MVEPNAYKVAAFGCPRVLLVLVPVAKEAQHLAVQRQKLLVLVKVAMTREEEEEEEKKKKKKKKKKIGWGV